MAVLGQWIAQQIFLTLGVMGGLTEVNVTSVTDPVIDPVTGLWSQTPATATYHMRVTAFSRTEIDMVQVIEGDRQARLPVSTYAGTPTTRDTMTIDGVLWEVRGVEKTANEGLWKWHLRRIGDA